MDGLIFLSIVIIWMVLQVWLLPKLGIGTRLNNKCDGSHSIHKEQSKDSVGK